MSSTRSRSYARLALLLAIPLLLRLAILLELHQDPFFKLLVVDARTYHETAVRMAAGTWRMDGPFWQPPLYPAVMGLVYRMAPRPILIRGLQCLLGSLCALLVFRLGERIAGRRAAWIAWGAAALCAPLIFFDLQILNASLVTFLLLASLDRLLAWSEKPCRRDLGLSGLLLGLASITVATSLVLFPIYAYWVWRRKPAVGDGRTGEGLNADGSRRDGPRRERSAPDPGEQAAWRGTRAAGWVLLCAVVPVLLVTLLNLAASHQVILVSYNGGVNFWIGNNPDYERTVAVRPGRAWQALTNEPIRAGVRSESGTSAWFIRQALHWISAHPLDWLQLLGKKVYLFFRGDELARNQEIYPFRTSSGLLRVLLWNRGLAFPSGILIPLGLLGLIWTWVRARSDRRDEWSLLALVLGAYSVGVIAFFVASRYRVPVLPLLAVFAGAAIVRGWEALRARRWTEFYPATGLLVLLLVLSNAGLPRMPRAFHSDTYSDMGTSELDAGRFDGARQWYQRALELDPDNAEAANNLGTIWLKQRRPELAEPLFRRVLSGWPEDEKALVNLGNCYLQKGEPYRAGRYFLDAQRLHPESADAATNLRTAEEMAEGLEKDRMVADPEAFLDLLRRFLEHEPENEFLRRRLRTLRGESARPQP